jgi:predicted HTH transcriptional regulator
MGPVEKAGTGFLRISQAMEEYKLDYPTIEANQNWFTIIFKRPDLQVATHERRNGSG